MMTIAATADTNDLYLDIYGNVAVVHDIEAVLQNCAHVMQTQLGECVLDIERGIPNFETVWTSQARLPQYEFAAIQALQSVPGVVEVLEFTSFFVGDVMKYSATIKTIYGTGQI
jgi:hypothetical protein